MRNEVTINKDFFIISRSIDNASKCRVVEICDNCFKVKLNNDGRYECDETVEMFTMTQEGQLYFETIVKEKNNDIISLWFPFTSKYLQRREYSRIQANYDILLKSGNDYTNVRMSDLSAGGLKLVTKTPLELLKEYQVSFNVENKNIQTVFKPFRIEALDNKFVSSGKFTNINNYDRIALFQFCFRKQIENSNL